MNVLLPVSVIAASAYLAVLVNHALDVATSAADAVGYVLVGTMLALAILEHLLLVLPLDATAVWRWAIAKRKPTNKPVAQHDSTAFSVARATPIGGAALDAHDKLF